MGHARNAKQDTNWIAQTTSVLHVEQDIIQVMESRVYHAPLEHTKMKKNKEHANHVQLDHIVPMKECNHQQNVQQEVLQQQRIKQNVQNAVQ